MYIFDGLLLIITKKRHFKAKILQNLLRNKNCLLIEPQMARNINLIKTGQRGKKWGFSAIHRTSNTRRKSNLHPHQSQFTLSTLQRDTLYLTWTIVDIWPTTTYLILSTQSLNDPQHELSLVNPVPSQVPDATSDAFPPYQSS